MKGTRRSGIGLVHGALSLRVKLLLLIFGIALSLVVTLIVLGLDAIQQSSATAQDISRSALESQARDHMLKVTAENAALNSQILDQTFAEAGMLAAAASQYFSEPNRYSAIGQLQGALDLLRMPEGHYKESTNEQASLAIPNFVLMNASIEEQILVSRVLDPIALSVINNNNKVAAVYYISTQDVIRYYPKSELDLPPDFKATDEIFFTSVLPEINPERQIRWTSVYDDPAGLGLMVSAIAPIYTNSDEFVGIIGIDFRLSDLGQTIEQSTLAAGSYSFLIDDNARAIALPDQGYIELLGRSRGENEFGADLSQLGGQTGLVVKAMQRGMQNVRRVTDAGEERFIAYTPLGENGWSLGTVVSTRIILSDVSSLQDALKQDAAILAFKKLIPLALLILLIVSSVGFFLINRFTQPLRDLTAAAAAIGRREWDVEIPHSGKDEIGLLSRTFADMVTQLKSLIGSLETRVNERTSELSATLVKLETSNEQLSNEVNQRRLSDEARADLEARFTHAFQSAPIGMALMNTHGRIISPNPQLQALFWPDFNSVNLPFLPIVVVDDERKKFLSFLVSIGTETASEEFTCTGHSGEIHKVVFFLSLVKSAAGNDNYIVLLAQDVTESRQLTERLQQQANHDELTGLPNRRAFAAALQYLIEAPPDKGDTHLLIMDLDQFKMVNDSCGHAEGDRLLVEVSNLITDCVRPTDMVARLGGDEFAVLLVGYNPEKALSTAECIRASIQQYEFYSDAQLFKVGVSIGLVNCARHTEDISEIQQLADAACYTAKEAGRNRIEAVSEHTDALDAQRVGMQWVQRLHDAMARDMFVLHGQHIEPLASQELPQYTEVLLRLWDEERNQLLPPGVFMPSAERYGLLTEIDKWVVSNLLQNLTDKSPTSQVEQRYFVNLSGTSLSDPEFAQFLVNRVKSAGLPSGTINFEVTETVVIKSLGNAKQLIDKLRALGCKIALDDFGTGLSSLVVLRSLGVDYLKIDGSFVKGVVTDEVDQLFMKSTIEIAHHLGIKTVAEYIENDEIREVAKSLGADYGQGFGIHRPTDLFSDPQANFKRAG